MFVLGRPSDDRLAGILADVAGADLTYPEVGATRDGDLPGGYHHVRVTATIGDGPADFAAAADGVRTWRLHRGQGFQVVPAAPALAPGTDVVVDAPLPGGVHAVAACRVVWVVDEPERCGFGYGTLPVHPETGEEAFVVDRRPTGEVTVTVVAFSRARHWLARLGGPVARAQQRRATAGYVDALRRHVALSRDRGPSAG
jgi:uncharacterized protein (UPF0548 family)